MSKYSGMGFEPAIILTATLLAKITATVVAVPNAYHLNQNSGGDHRMSGDGPSSSVLPDVDHPQKISKRSFDSTQCKGVYDKTNFAKLDRVCDDCYDLFREPKLHSLCRKNCFTSDFFKACLDVLIFDKDQVEEYKRYIIQLFGGQPAISGS